MPELFDQEDIRRRIAQRDGLDVDPFNAAMIATEMEDLIAKSCMGCGVPAETTVLWVLPRSALAGRMSVPDDTSPTLIIPLCQRCGVRSQTDEAFSNRLVKAGIASLIEFSSQEVAS